MQPTHLIYSPTSSHLTTAAWDNTMSASRHWNHHWNHEYVLVCGNPQHCRHSTPTIRFLKSANRCTLQAYNSVNARFCSQNTNHVTLILKCQTYSLVLIFCQSLNNYNLFWVALFLSFNYLDACYLAPQAAISLHSFTCIIKNALADSFNLTFIMITLSLHYLHFWQSCFDYHLQRKSIKV